MLTKDQIDWSDKQQVLKRVAKVGYDLQYAHKSLQTDPDIVKIAVARNGLSLYHAHESLRADREIVKIAVTQTGWALRFAHERLQADREIVNLALAKSLTNLAGVHESLKDDEMFVSEMLNLGEDTRFIMQYMNFRIQQEYNTEDKIYKLKMRKYINIKSARI